MTRGADASSEVATEAAAATSRSEGPHGASAWFWPAIVALGVGAVFGVTLGFEFVNWDDHIYVVENALVTAPGSAPLAERLGTPGLGYPVPLPVAVYGLLWALGEGSPAPFHAFNLLVHLANAGLVFAILRGVGLRGATTALLTLGFALHPLVVEPVAWVTGLKDLLMTLGAGVAWRWRTRPGVMFAGGALALAAKPVAVGLGLGLAFALWLDARRTPERQALAGRTPTRRAWATAAILTAAGAGVAAFASAQESEALRTTLDLGFSAERVLAAGGLLSAHALVPLDLTVLYTPSMAEPGMALLGFVAVGMALWHLWKWTRARDPRAALVALSLLLYLPVSNLRPLVRFTADSYAYAPWFFVVLVVGTTLARAPAWSRRVHIGGSAFVLGWGLISVGQVQVWRDSVSLWEAAYVAQPESGELIYRFGDALGRSGKARDEMALYLSSLEALESAPKVPVALPVFFTREGQLGEAARWYGLAFEKAERQDEALYWYYVELVTAHPELHDPRHDDALRYAIERFEAAGRVARLDVRQRRALAAMETRLESS